MTGRDCELVAFGSRRPLIVLTNDDGVTSPGLCVLKAALDPLGDVQIVAPDQNRSGAARSITMHAPLWVEEVALPDGSLAYSTDGTPVDCVRMAALGLLDRSPDLIVSGINLGENLGDDITYSGTVAAAFEGIMLEIPAIAMSAQGYHPGYDLDRSGALRRAGWSRSRSPEGLSGQDPAQRQLPDRRWEELEGARLTVLGRRDLRRQGRAPGHQRQPPPVPHLQRRPGVPPRSGHRLRGRVRGLRVGDSAAVRTDVTRGARAAAPLGRSARALRGRPATAAGSAEGAGRPLMRADVQSRGVRPRRDPGGLGRADHRVVPARHPRGAGTGGHRVRRRCSTWARPLQEQMVRISPEHADELVAVYREFNHREHDRMLKLYDGILDLLNRLTKAGVLAGPGDVQVAAHHADGLRPHRHRALLRRHRLLRRGARQQAHRPSPSCSAWSTWASLRPTPRTWATAPPTSRPPTPPASSRSR